MHQSPITIAFRILEASLRGTEVAIFDYATANEELLNNKSIIIIQENPYNNQEVIHKFRSRFNIYFYNTIENIESILSNNNCKILYTIGFGNRNVNNPSLSINNKYKTALHCVFTLDDPHADTYIPISQYLANKYKNKIYNVVPHIVKVCKLNDQQTQILNFRKLLNIPEDVIVFGRYGGIETFNIDFVKDVIANTIDSTNNYYLFANTEKFIDHPHIIFLDPIVNAIAKSIFINSCDAMIHARANGETFGIACGEFSKCNKPIITYNGNDYGDFYDRAHLDILGNKCLTYHDYNSLEYILSNFKQVKSKQEEIIKENNRDCINLWDAYSDKYSENVVIHQWWEYLIKPLL